MVIMIQYTLQHSQESGVTCDTLRPLKKRLIGQRSQLSEGDVTLLNKMYPCTGSDSPSHL